jgi:ParB-like chromosome segregation protein Spo0J
MKIESKEIQLVDINRLVNNPKNNNKHPPEQIERLSKLIEAHGFRNPIVVSKRTGYVVAGHGRIAAAKGLGINLIPVMYQDFENEAQEYAYLTSDNAIASWAELDLSAVNTEMLDLGPDFDIDLLGIKDFTIEPIEKFELDDISDDDIAKGVRKAIQIEFESEHFEEAKELVGKFRKNGHYVGMILISTLRKLAQDE